jgi:hypothetical protein
MTRWQSLGKLTIPATLVAIEYHRPRNWALETRSAPIGWLVGNWEVNFWFARDTLKIELDPKEEHHG